jgi:hypothetical protein
MNFFFITHDFFIGELRVYAGRLSANAKRTLRSPSTLSCRHGYPSPNICSFPFPVLPLPQWPREIMEGGSNHSALP